MENAASWSCVTKMVAMLLSRSMPATSRRMSRRRPASRLLNGSSSMTAHGRGAMVRATATLCCCPPESSCGYRPSKPSSFTSRMTSLSLPLRSGPGSLWRPKLMFSATVLCGKSAYSWKTMPTFLRSGASCCDVPDTTRPSILISPSSSLSKPAMRRRSVVLPAPLGPRMESTSPGMRAKLMPLTAGAGPKLLATAVHSMTGGLMSPWRRGRRVAPASPGRPWGPTT